MGHVSLAGIRRSVALRPANTSEADLVTFGPYGGALIDLIVSNSDASARLATVQWYDGTTDWDILPTKSIAATDLYRDDLHVEIPANGKIKVTAGTANVLTFTATIVEYIGGIGREHAH